MRPLAIFLVLGAGLLAPAFGQAPQPDEDGPGRGVARLSLMNGEVSIRRGDSGDVVAAAPNAPLVVLDRILTGPTSRAELQFDASNMIRIGANAEVRLSELEYHRYQIQIAQGTTTFRVLRNQIAQVELSTPSVSVHPLRQGVYRVTVHEDGTSEISVRSGEVEIASPRGSERLGAGRTMIARGTVNDPEFQVVAGLPMDDWDRWNDARDHDLLRSQSFNNIPQDVYGAEELDSNGVWTEVPSYGRVWHPAVGPDWAPYREGRWVWVDYYGWTWVSADPWGWAPYHYGRWFNEPGVGWCWWPGGPGRTYWRPALVAFFGWGSYGGFHAGVGFGFGHVGWVPLAPFEPFHPWYGRGYYGGYRGGTTIVNNTTIINNQNIAGTYRNARVANGITGVNAENFGRGHVSSSNYVRASGADIQRAGLVRGQMPLTPARESLRMSDRQAQAASVPRASDSRQFYSTRPAARVDRVPFEQQRQSVDQSARRTFGDSTSRSGDFSNRGGAAPSTVRQGESNTGRWRRVGESPSVQTPNAQAPNSQMSNPQGNSRSVQQQDSWHRFGEPAQHTTTQPGATDSGRSNNVRTDSSSHGTSATPQDNSSWRRFGDPASGRSGTPAERQSSPAPQYQRPTGQNYSSPSSSAPRSSQDMSRGGSAGSSGHDSSAVRINPPIVRERSAPSSHAEPSRNSGGSAPQRSSGGGGGGGGSSDRGGHHR